MESFSKPKPARQVVTRSPKRSVGILNCPWFQPAAVHHESRLEKHFVLRAILSPIVQGILHQPFEITLGPKERYTPDFLLTFLNGQRAVVEVKRSERIKGLQDRLDRVADRLAVDGIPFFVVHQGQIEGERKAERAALFRRYAMFNVDSQKLNDAVALVHSRPSGISISSVMKRCRMSQPQLFHAIARRLVVLGPKLLASDSDPVYPPLTEISDASHQFGSWFGCAAWRTHA